MTNSQLADYPQWTQDEIHSCDDCLKYDDGLIFLCGWHENVVVAVRIVKVTGGTFVREGEQ